MDGGTDQTRSIIYFPCLTFLSFQPKVGKNLKKSLRDYEPDSDLLASPQELVSKQRKAVRVIV
jgi:hypothetical protein